MTLYQQIMQLYPKLTPVDFNPITGTILLINLSNGNPTFIGKWNNTQYPKPTPAQIQGTT